MKGKGIRMTNRRVQGTASLGLALAFILAALTAAPAAAAPPSTPLPQCADTVTPGSLTPGQNAIGFSVTHGDGIAVATPRP